MGKKSFYTLGKKSFFKSSVKPFFKSNRIVFAAIAGAAAGVVITRMLGSEKTRQVFSSMESTLGDLSHKFMNGSKEAALKIQKAS